MKKTSYPALIFRERNQKPHGAEGFMAGRDKGMSAQERLFWEAVRRALLMAVRAIENRRGMDGEGDRPPRRTPGARVI
jgi:hypothetical protein